MGGLVFQLLKEEGLKEVASLGKQGIANRLSFKLIDKVLRKSPLGDRMKNRVGRQLWKKSDLLKHVNRELEDESGKPKHLRRMKFHSLPGFSKKSWREWIKRRQNYYKNQRTPYEKLKGLMKRRTGGDAIKQFFNWEDRLGFQRNQSSLFGNKVNLANLINPHSNAQKDESRILHQMAREKRQTIDRAPLSSSGLYAGAWYAPTSGGLAGNLELNT